MSKDRDAGTRKDEVRAPAQASDHGSIDKEAQAATVEFLAKRQFKLGVAAPVARELVELEDLDLSKVAGSFLKGKRRGKLKASTKTRLKDPK